MYVYTAVAILIIVSMVQADPRVRPHVECESDAVCTVPSSACVDGLCQCQGKAHFYGLPPTGCFVQEERGKAINEYRKAELQHKLACYVDTDCEHIPASTCIKMECQCKEPKALFTKPYIGCYTLQERQELYKTLVEKKKAQDDKRANGETILDEDHVHVGDQPPATVCTTDAHCADYEHAVCLEGKCLCTEGDVFHGFGDHVGCFGKSAPQTLLNRQRRQSSSEQLGTVCDNHGNCTIANSGCDNGFCTCFNGFYKTDAGKCEEIELGVPCDGKPAVFCAGGVLRAQCIEGTCQCPAEYPVQSVNLEGRPACNSATLERSISGGVRSAFWKTTQRQVQDAHAAQASGARSGPPSPAKNAGEPVRPEFGTGPRRH